MAIPTPEPKEPDADYVSRCMGDKAMHGDFPDQAQRAAVCYRALSEHKKTRHKSILFEDLRAAVRLAAAASQPLMPSMQMMGGKASGRTPYPMLINPTHSALGPMVRNSNGRTNTLLLGNGNVAMAEDSLASHNDMGMDCQACDPADMTMLALSSDMGLGMDGMDPATMHQAASAWSLRSHASYPHTTNRTRVQVHDARGAPVPPRDWPAGLVRGVTANSTG